MSTNITVIKNGDKGITKTMNNETERNIDYDFI